MRNKQRNRRPDVIGLLLVAHLLAASACSAANTITMTPIADALTYSTVRIIWLTSEISTTTIRWGVSGPPYANVTSATPQANNTREHAWFLSGLKPVTTYHFSVCSAANGGTEVCSEDQTFTTTERGSTGPIPPAAVDVTMPEATGAELFVGANCDDPDSGLLARWTQAGWGDTVVIPVTTRCTGNYVFPAKTADTNFTHRWIITRSSASNQLPPPGSRIDPVADGAKLARVQTNRPTLLYTNSANRPEACEAGSYAWVTDDSRSLKLQQCRPLPALSITQGSGAGAPLSITVPNHGITGRPFVRIQGVTGNTNANGTFQATVTGPNTLDLAYRGWRTWTGNGSFSGGQMQRNAWQTVSFNSGATLPETCTVGAWFLANGAGDAQDRSYRCLEANAWTRFSLQGSFDFKGATAIDLGTNAAHHQRFIGLEVTVIRLPLEPLWLQYNSDPFRSQPGSVFMALVYQNEKNSDIVWDRCWVHGNSDRSKTAIGFTFDGSNVAVMDSVVSDIFLWTGVEPGSGFTEAAAIAFNIGKGPGPLRLENNFIEAGGISFFVQSDFCCALPSEPNDATIRRNTFYVGDEWRFGSSNFAGKKIVMRHLLELKFGRRWLIEGNIFDGTFTTVQQAAALAFTPRGDNGVFLIGTVVDGVATMSTSFGFCPVDTQVGDWVTIKNSSNPDHNRGWRVTAVDNGGCRVTLDGAPGSSTSGFLQIMTNRKSLTDIDVRSNTFKNIANGIFIIGHTDGAGAPAIQLETARRIRIHNNLFQSIDGNRANSHDSSYLPIGIGGYPVYVSLGMEDLHFTNNTVVSSVNGPALSLENSNICAPGGTCNPNTGLLYENNILNYGLGTGPGGVIGAVTTAALWGTAALDALWKSGDEAGWIFRKNVIALRGNLPTQAPFGPYPANNRSHNLNNGELPFTNPSAANYRLRALYRSFDNCYGRVGDCSTNGGDVGVNFAELSAAQGSTSQARLQRVGSRQLALQASTYRAGYCAAEASTDSFLTKTTASVFGEGRFRTFWFDNLSPGTVYQYRARCGNGSVLTGQTQTRNLGVDRRFELRLKPPVWLRSGNAVHAVISTGSSPATLNTTHTLACTSGCTLRLAATDGQLIYYKVQYQYPGNVTVAVSPIRAWAP